jgi:hypothetical protein
MAGTTVERRLKLLPLVKAYPNLSRRYGEVSCVAGIDMENQTGSPWIRAYPIPFRSLDRDDQFAKYQPIRVNASTPRGDLRPESRRVDIESIETVGERIDTEHGWEKRRPYVEPLIDGSMCDLMKAEARDRTSLGIIRPRKVTGLKIEPVEPRPEKGKDAEAWAAQGQLGETPERQLERQALEQIPYRFKYHYTCHDEACGGHRQSVVDWEIFELYRSVRHQSDWQEAIRKKWIAEMCGLGKETAFIVGNQHQYRQGFLVLGVWWPPVRQLSLADPLDL